MTIEKELSCILAFFSFWFGACIASFLNVVIWRAPRGESIVSPPSHCPKCGASIRWWQNIPIISWLSLAGKCASCRAPISPRYILVETLGGALFLAAFLKYNPVYPFVWIPMVWTLLVAWIWIALMIAGSFIDFDHQLLPDFTTVGGMVLGLVFWLGCSIWLCMSGGEWTLANFFGFGWSVAGLALGFGLLWFVRWLGTMVFKREAMGMGDVFLMGAVGALYGPVAVLFTLIASSVLGSVVGFAMIAMSKAKLGRFTAIPYGPYICMACLLWIFCGEELVSWYLSLLGVR